MGTEVSGLAHRGSESVRPRVCTVFTGRAVAWWSSGVRQGSEVVEGMTVYSGHVAGTGYHQISSHMYLWQTMQNEQQTKQNASHLKRDATFFQQCPSSTLYWQSLTSCTLQKRNANCPVHISEQILKLIFDLRVNKLLTGIQANPEWGISSTCLCH